MDFMSCLWIKWFRIA